MFFRLLFPENLPYGDGVDNTVEDNSSVFILIRNEPVPVSKGMRTVKLLQRNRSVLS